MVIEVQRHVERCYTVADGLKIAALLRRSLGAGEKVTVSFLGISGVPSSFVNGAFISLLSSFSADEIREKVRIVDSTRQINELVRSRIAAEAPREREFA
jgi:hypothetical protein